MLKSFIKKVIDRVDLPVLLKLATKSTDRSNTPINMEDICTIITDETTRVIKSLIFKYVIVMNFIAGIIGFSFGCILILILR